MVAFVVNVTMATSASAHAYFVGGKEVTTKEEATLTTPAIELYVKINGVKVRFTCLTSITGALEKGGEATFEDKIESCELFIISKGKETELTNCSVTALTKWAIHGLLVEPGALVEEELKPKSGSVIFELELKGTGCTIGGKNAAAKYKLEGSQLCEIEAVSIELGGHFIECPTTGSKVKFGGEPASMKIYNWDVFLKSSNKWYAE
jgi:hypothetical protein